MGTPYDDRVHYHIIVVLVTLIRTLVAHSGSMQAIMRTIAPSGFLHSFEFNEIRATTAQEEFENNGLGEKKPSGPSVCVCVERFSFRQACQGTSTLCMW